jgi:hypothetical protein
LIFLGNFNKKAHIFLANTPTIDFRSITVFQTKYKKGELPDDKNLIEFDTVIKNEDKKLELMKNEHERWNAFMRSEGFRTVAFPTVKKYAPITRSHKDEDAKLHPCIVSWEDLDPLQKEYDALQNKLSLKISNFKEYDEKLVVEIPKIIKRANEFSKEGW